MSAAMRRVVLLIAAVAVLAAVGWSARPQPVMPAARVEAITAELRCPVCQGLSVSDSPSETAREMRDLVAQRVAEGRTDDEIRAEFRRSYGDWVFLTPPLFGLTGFVWLAPFAALVVGALFALRLVRRPTGSGAVPGLPRVVGRRGDGATTGIPSPPPSDVSALRERVRQEEAFE
jgi:cytochrome c-type biogenesis protein CcmH